MEWTGRAGRGVEAVQSGGRRRSEAGGREDRGREGRLGKKGKVR